MNLERRSSCSSGELATVFTQALLSLSESTRAFPVFCTAASQPHSLLILYLCHLFITQKPSACLELSIPPLCHLYLFFLSIPAPTFFFLVRRSYLFTFLPLLSLTLTLFFFCSLCFCLFPLGQWHCMGRGGRY